ncbi:amino acid adenylation domain-containing protein [Actinokineospora guangxiensis]|uniref:Amino acid adenylation domain-containing protein n=1 Tax=Actinokineospora guangxiensis TaxID=1490288 RepID=A0ABW0EGC2_9PSEU
MTSSGGGFPLSFAQEQLWFLDQLRSGATEYLMHWAYRLRGPVDTGALASALTEIAARHEVLRTRYESVDGVPVQVIDPPGPAPLAVVAVDGEAGVRELGAADVATPIDLRAAWPWRVTLASYGPDESVLMFAVHHIAFDGWSIGVLADELSTLYAAFLAGEPSPLPELEVQYVDYVEWQRDWWESPDGGLRKQQKYWSERLAGLAPLELPADRPRPATWEPAGDSVEFTVPAELAAAVTAVGRRHDATPFMTLMAAYQLLLSRYARTEDVAVGVSIAGRAQVELESLAGLFLNTVVLRTDLAGEPTFGELLARVRNTALDAFGNQDVPFERVVNALAPERDLSRNPVFQVAFGLHNQRRTPLALAGVEVEKWPGSWQTSPFDLSLHFAEQPDGSLFGTMNFPTALFDRARVERMAANYTRLLAEAAAAPGTPVGALEIMAEAEVEQLLAWNTAAAARPEATLPELVAAQAAATPDAVAVIEAGATLTYAELMGRVEPLAAALRARGVGPEIPVGVAMERGADLVTALLAVWTAGGVYVPLPPDHPADRLAAVAADALPALVLTHEALRDLIPGAPVLTIDGDWDTGLALERPALSGANAAYVIYTSGSTGKPKGVVIPHEGIRNRVLWAVESHGLGAADRVLQKTTIGFDASVWEFAAPLVCGGTVVMAPPTAHKDPAVMVAAVAEHGVTVLQLVPSVLRMVAEEPKLAECTALRLLCSAGEPLPTALCATVLDAVAVEIVNTYGPTECSIDATAWPHTAAEQAEIAPIGAPLPNMAAYVVDADDRLVPLGVPGELCVSGVGVARGYLGRGDLTAEKFGPNPYSATPGGRWYRTGDLVRRRADGDLEFLGRIDHQVKVRGVRVEPGEVEAALRAHPDVEAVTVTAHRTDTGDLELVAYTVSRSGVGTDALRDHLAELLPAPMIPAFFVALEALPLNASGKVDRAALPAPGLPEPVADGDRVEPRTATEQAVARVMGEVLGVESVSASDDFFALGGHSLLAIRLVLKLRREFDLELSVGELFAERTVEKLAAFIDHQAGAAKNIPIATVDRTGALQLSFGQERMWFLDRLEPDSAEYIVPLAFRLHGPFDVVRFRAAVDLVAARHEILRTRHLGESDPVQVIDPAGPVAFEFVDPGTPELARAAIDRASAVPFDLAAEHPIRVTVARAEDTDHFVAVTLHHIAFDAWSMGIFLRDLGTAYRDPAALPAPPAAQYADFGAWQRGLDLADQLDYWRDRLAGLSALELPTDRPRPAVRDPRGDTVMADVPDAVVAGITELGSRNGATPFMTMLAAFHVLLARYTGRTDIAVGTPVAGRTREETEEILGFFVNNLVLRADLGGDPLFTDLLDQVRGSTLAAFGNQDVPFEHLVEAISTERDLSRNPLFQVMFELAHLDEVPATLGEAELKPFTTGAQVAKFDLTLSVKQLGDGSMRVWLEYATGLFDRATIERMTEHYLTLLAGIATTPGARLSELELSPAAERAELAAWADRMPEVATALDPVERHDLTFPELVALRAAEHPGKTAVVFNDSELSYAELDARANQVARHLRALGVGPEVIVGCCLQRGLDAVVSLLGVMRAGGVYTPFDPAHPGERLAFMLADAGAQVVVTNAEFAERLASEAYHLVRIDADAEAIAAHDGAALERTAGPGNLAYVIYTSGSTGKPKGVMIEHRSYAHHSYLIAEAFGITGEDRVALLSALTFDAAMEQVAGTLATGATLIVSDPVFWTPEDLPAHAAAHGATVMELTPAYYREIMAGKPQGLSTLRLVNVGSDVVTVDDVNLWSDSGLPGRFVCNYGPTEATITSVLHWPVPADLTGDRAAAMPIGLPIPGTRAVIVDADLRPVPLGVPGELCLGGVRLARGYLDRPELTADRFVPDPDGDGTRLYRTGDLVRHRPDGTIAFLGRIDQQVKIRGFRIELGEIEAALVRHPAVREAVVVARGVAGAAPGDKRLCAYLVCPDGDPGIGALREHLRDLLPEYMVPSLWTTLPELPMTASKKIDRKALPDPVAGGDAGFRAPRDPAEEAVAEIWASVLDREAVGIDDNFFALGGHSLLATRVLAQLRAAFGVDLPLRLLFETTTLADLAAAVADAVAADVASLSDEDIQELLAKDGVS